MDLVQDKAAVPQETRKQVVWYMDVGVAVNHALNRAGRIVLGVLAYK